MITQRIIILGRLIGNVVSWPFVLAATVLTELTRNVWATVGGVWKGTAGLLPPEQNKVRERQKKLEERRKLIEARREERLKAAEAQQEKERQEAGRRVRNVGAIREIDASSEGR